MHRLDGGVKAGETDRVQKYIRATQPAVKLGAVLPGYECDEPIRIEPVTRKGTLKPFAQLLGKPA
ncbi:hypothetical protein D3C83_145470 [compost metagenome]